uniref:Metallophos domain-containing protein n=1 Tax=Wuchereria bancrofti TaxID=6293 RepID=A0A1I8EEV2_WUCBA
MGGIWSNKTGLLLVILFVVIYNEYLTYYITIYMTCSWPIISTMEEERKKETRVIILTDIHLLLSNYEYWFDKIRWFGMANVSVVSISLILRGICIVSGDLFDGSTISSQQDLINYANHFNELFYVPKNVERHCIVGNHDIISHHKINPVRLQFFSQHFSRSLVDHVVIGGNHFVLLNSMTIDCVDCLLRNVTKDQVEQLSQIFNCNRNLKTPCNVHSRPILLLHVPLYRDSDSNCANDYDVAPEPRKSERFRAGFHCLSNASSHYILKKLRPRAIFDGHLHYSCRTWWPSPYNAYEWTLSSFSWRNIPQPAFLLVNKCLLPNKKTIIASYVILALGLLFFLFYRLVFSILWHRKPYCSCQFVTQKWA